MRVVFICCWLVLVGGLSGCASINLPSLPTLPKSIRGPMVLGAKVVTCGAAGAVTTSVGVAATCAGAFIAANELAEQPEKPTPPPPEHRH